MNSIQGLILIYLSVGMVAVWNCGDSAGGRAFGIVFWPISIIAWLIR